jgi:hypothetical protein
MSRPLLIVPLGFALAVLVALSAGTRPSVKAQQSPALISTNAIGGALGGRILDEERPSPPVYLPARPMSIAETKTRLKLQEKIPMNFPNDTPLEDVKKYIEQATIDKADFPEGISLYFDPLGLQEAEKTMASPFRIDLKNLPLETTLALLLKQLGLTYWVNKDGLVIITAESDDLVTPSSLDHEILSNLAALRSEVRALRFEVQSLRRGGVPEDRESSRPPSGIAPGGSGTRGGMM